MTGYEPNERAIDIAIPVIAVECEATPPVEGYLDAYEIAVLKFVQIGLSSGGISKTMNSTESLIESVMTNLQEKGYLDKEYGKPWKITETGEKYLLGEEDSDRASTGSVYGYMFVNAIKKEIFPYFLEGDIDQVDLYVYHNKRIDDNGEGNYKGKIRKITNDTDERKTFSDIQLKKSKLKEAYKQFYRIKDLKQDLEEGNISYEEAVQAAVEDDMFFDVVLDEDIDSFDEYDPDVENEAFEYRERMNSSKLTDKMFVRPLVESRKNVYLHMRMIIDPTVPGGYKVDSPFRLRGIDNGFFKRQLQWLASNEEVKIDGESLNSFIEREIRKISPLYKNHDKDFGVFALEKMPLLKLQRDMHRDVYSDMEDIYTLIQNQKTLIEKKHIVGDLSHDILEGLYNDFFRGIDRGRRNTISRQAQNELKAVGKAEYIRMLLSKTKLSESDVGWSFDFMNGAVKRLERSKGNSIIEKFINLVVVNYYIGTEETDRLLNSEYIKEFYNLSEELNQIRIKVSHKTADRFDERDYTFFMNNVFKMINWLLEAYCEG